MREGQGSCSRTIRCEGGFARRAVRAPTRLLGHRTLLAPLLAAVSAPPKRLEREGVSGFGLTRADRTLTRRRFRGGRPGCINVPASHLMGAEDGCTLPGGVARKSIPGESYVGGYDERRRANFRRDRYRSGVRRHTNARRARTRRLSETDFNPSTFRGTSAAGWPAAGADCSFAKVLQSCRTARLSERTR